MEVDEDNERDDGDCHVSGDMDDDDDDAAPDLLHDAGVPGLLGLRAGAARLQLLPVGAHGSVLRHLEVIVTFIINYIISFISFIMSTRYPPTLHPSSLAPSIPQPLLNTLQLKDFTFHPWVPSHRLHSDPTLPWKCSENKLKETPLLLSPYPPSQILTYCPQSSPLPSGGLRLAGSRARRPHPP